MFVQLQKNQSLHAGIKCTPFKAVCGFDPKTKLESNIVPSELKLLILDASSTNRCVLNEADEDSQVDESEPADPVGPLENDFGKDNSFDNKIMDSVQNQPGPSNQLISENSNMRPKVQKRCKRKLLETTSGSSSDENETIPRTYLTRKRKFALETVDSEPDAKSNSESDAKSDFESDQFDDCVSGNETVSKNVDKEEANVDLSLANEESQNINKIILCCVCNLECNGFHMCIICDQFAHAICGETQGEEGCGGGVICRRCELKNTIQTNTLKQANRMLKRSNQKFCEVSTGDNVMIPIPEEDRAKCEFPNLVAIVLDKIDDYYVVGCRAGWIRHNFLRNGFEKCSSNFLTPEDIPTTYVSLREAATSVSVDGKGQGTFKCNCKKKFGRQVQVQKSQLFVQL